MHADGPVWGAVARCGEGSNTSSCSTGGVTIAETSGQGLFYSRAVVSTHIFPTMIQDAL